MARAVRVSTLVVSILTVALPVLVLLSLTLVDAPAAAHADDETDGPQVFLIHGMPDAVFEVQVGPDRRLKGLRFGQFYNLRAFAGTTLSFGFKLLETGEPVAATEGYLVPDDRSSSLVVHHAADGSGALTAFENRLDPLEPGMSRLVVRHLAAAEPFDVLIDGEQALTGIEHGWEESIELPEGDVSVSLVTAGGDDAVVDPVEISLTAGDRIVVYGFGSVDDETLAIVTDVVHGVEGDPDDGPPLRALAASTALAVVIGAVGFGRLHRRSRSMRGGPRKS